MTNFEGQLRCQIENISRAGIKISSQAIMYELKLSSLNANAHINFIWPQN